MAIKWKNNLLLTLAVIFCLGGWYTAYTSFNRINTVDNTLYSFDPIALESMYLKDNLEDFPETKKEDISQEQVDMYRYSYGDLGTQVLDIKNQFQEKIEQTKEEKEKETLIKERDSRIQAVVENFTDDNVVKNKIIEEENVYIEKNKKSIKSDASPHLEGIDVNYLYYFKDNQTTDVYTNVKGLSKFASEEEVKDKLKSQGLGKVYQESFNMDLNTFIKEEARAQGLFQSTRTTLKGSYVVNKNSPLADRVKQEEKGRELFSQLFYVGLFSMLIGIVILYTYVNTKIIYGVMKKIPIDLGIAVFLVAGFIAASFALFIYPYNLGTARTIRMLFVPLVVGLISITVSFISLKIVWQMILPKHREKEISVTFKESLIYKGYSIIKVHFNQLSLGAKLAAILLLGIMTAVLFLIFLNSYMGSLYRLITGSVLLVLVIFEIRFIYQTTKKVKELLLKPKKWLQEYEQEINSEVSLNEFEHELTQMNELIEVSKKDTMQSEMLKAELLTNVSHDLRTPLTSIITYGELLKQETLSEADRKEYVAVINKKSQRMKTLIDDLFEVTKMNNGGIVLEKSEVNLTQLLQQSVSEYSEEFEEHHLKVIFNKPEEAISLSLDGERMWRVFDNIFGNAIKYSMPETRVYLKLEKQGEMARIELKNISQHELNEEADQLMEKFQRGDSSRHTEGSGLGLAIINSIVSLHDGSIDISVDGDLFKLNIYLPL